MLMESRGFPLNNFLGLEGSLQGWMRGFVHEEDSPGTSKVNSKVGQEKNRDP
jgi:hypothetical protein